ncbi:hypothetical protein [Aquipseudomonas guryensis]|uniref:Uncharacterized protein n=1 Tax=Aquipseudomonas guryensis TaxID=2759165 RepID=A0A7W4DAP3_9GAMM|nr:hypothetical protein [Pseudomonas guryensis]MBB1519124.1 hypothetical protein [Pseudomonas guryensis]
MRLLAVKLLLTLLVAAALAYPLLQPEADAGIFRELEMLGPLAAISLTLLFLLAVFLYCRDLQCALSLVRPECRAAAPRSVWLMFLLPYNFIEDFFIVAHVTQSLRREAQANDALRPFSHFGMLSGIGWCSAQILSLIPHAIGSLAGLLALPLWLAHWHLIRRINRALRAAPPAIVGQGQSQP